MPERPNDSLHALLHEAEAELSRRLQEACEAESKGVATESAEEIRRLEDTLLSAAMAAERTIAARRHLQADSPPPKERSMDSDGTSPSSTSVREFEDKNGKNWRAWPVTPDLGHARTASRRSLGDFQDGWICFEALDNSGRRRLPRLGRRWSDLAADELPRLLDEAITVPARRPAQPEAPSRGAIGKLS